MKDEISTMPGGEQPSSEGPRECRTEVAEGEGVAGDEVTSPPIMSRLERCEQFENWQEVWNPRFSMSMNHTKGLLNAPGQNNCFLNSAVQVLWHLDVFRRSFRLLSGHSCMGNSCIFCALKVIFTQFQYSDQTALPPDSLRKALAKSFYEQRRFQQGHMDDAAECFENILTRMHFHLANEEPEDSCKAKHCIPHQKFSMQVVEQIVCQCGANSDPLPFTQTVQYVSAKALVNQGKLVAQQNADPSESGFAQLLRFAVSEGDVRNCPSKCGKKVTIRRNLTNAPDVVSIGLIWDTDRPSLQYVNDVLRCIGTQLNLRDLFDCDTVDSPDLVLRLQGVVCYYGKHYSTFFFHSKMKKWTYFDDAHVKELDSQWSSVTEKCLRGHYQPLLLLYGTEDSQPITTETAPQKTTMLPGYQSFSSPEESDGKSKRRGHPKYVKYESQYRRSMTPNPEMEFQRKGNYEMAASLRRAVTPGPEQMNGHWNGQYDSDEEAQDRQQVNGCHFRQASYLTAMDRINHGGYHDQQVLEQRAMDSRKPRMYGGQSQQYVSHSDVQSHYPQQQYPGRPADHYAHQQQYPYQYHQQAGSQSHQKSYEDWTLSNNSQYRRPQGVPSSPVQSVPLANPVPSNSYSSSMHPQPANNLHQSTSDPLAKVNEIQRMESFKKGNSKGADVVRYQYANETDSQKIKTMTAPDARKASYKKFGSMADLTSDARHGQGEAPGGRPHVALQRTRSLENALETEGDTRPVTQPASYDRPPSKERPPVQPRPTSAFEPVSAHARNYDVVDGRPPSGKASWQASKKNDNYGTYISRKTVESILSAQGIRAGLKKPVESSKVLERPKQQLQHQIENGDNLSMNSHKDSGYRSGSSGDRNSASSTSSMSADSVIADPYRGGQHHSHMPPTEGPRTAAQSYVPNKQQVEPPLPNKLLPPKMATSNRQHSSADYEDPYDHLPAHSGRPVQGQPLSLPQKKLAPDMECESLCIKAESLMEQSMEKERIGNLSAALAYCNLAIDEIQQGLGIPNCQQETRMYTKMKLNTCIMRSRSLHRRMLIQQQDPNSEDQTSVSSISTDPETRDYELNHSSGHYQAPDGSKYPIYQQEAHYMAQYSSDSGYSEYSDSGKAGHVNTVASREGAKNTADIYGTLPKKGSQKGKSQSVTAKDTEAYQAYLQRQKNMNRAQTESALPRPSNQSQPPPYSAPQHLHHNQPHPHSQQRHPSHPVAQHAHQNEGQYRGHAQHMYQRQQSVPNPASYPENHSQHHVVPNQMPANQLRQTGNNKMSKEEIRHLLYTDFVSRGKGSRDQGGQPPMESTEHQRIPHDLYGELQDKMGHMTVRNQQELDQVDGAVPAKGFAVFPPQMHPYHGKPPPVNVPTNHSRESSTSSTHTLQAHSRDNSQSSQHSINAHLQAYMHHQEQISHQADDGDNGRSQVLPPKPSVIGRIDKMKRHPSEMYATKNWNNSEQQYNHQFSSDLQTPRVVQKSTSQGALYTYQAGLDVESHLPAPVDVKNTEPGMEGQTCFDGEQKDCPPPQPGTSEGQSVPLTAAESLEKIGADSSQPEHSVTVQQPGRLPPAGPTFSTFQRPSASLVGGERPRSQAGLPGQRTSTTSTTSYESSNNTSMEQEPCNAPSSGEPPKTPKSILKKRSRSKRTEKIAKSISFSDNIALIADVQDTEPEVDYVAYVSNLEKNSPKARQRSASLSNLKGEQGSKTGYDSDFDDDTSDSASSTETAGEISRCNLCHKHVVESGHVYCPDCSFYMSRLQPQES